MTARTLHTMGTVLEFLTPDTCPASLWQKVRAELLRLDKVFNRFDPESGLSHYVSSGRTDDPDLLSAINLAACYRHLTSGLFDVNVSGSPDVGGFAKGYALRQIRLIVEDAGVENLWISFGGSSILALGNRPGSKGWEVDVTDPYSGESLMSYRLCNEALSVSGNSPGYCGHILNPISGEACCDRRLVVARCLDPLDAEVISTAIMVGDASEVKIIEANFPGIDLKMFLV